MDNPTITTREIHISHLDLNPSSDGRFIAEVVEPYWRINGALETLFARRYCEYPTETGDPDGMTLACGSCEGWHNVYEIAEWAYEELLYYHLVRA